ncbi:MAG: hypothetical protein WBQ45_01595, partial [Roseiarcus sp.]
MPDHPLGFDIVPDIQLDEDSIAGRVGENLDSLFVAFQRRLVGVVRRVEFGLDRVPMDDESLVEVVGCRIDCLARDLNGLEPRLLFLRLEPKRRDHLGRLAGQNFRCKHVGEREPLWLVGAEVVEADIEGVTARILG